MSTRFLVKHNNTDTTLCHLILVMATIAKAIKQLDPLLPFNLEPPLFICQLTQTQDPLPSMSQKTCIHISGPRQMQFVDTAKVKTDKKPPHPQPHFLL